MAVATPPNRRHSARPVRRAFGVVAVLVAASDLAVATAVEGNGAGIPTVPTPSQVPMIGYGGLLALIGLWSVATSFGRRARRPQETPTSDGREERMVIHALRAHGWYVADDVVLPHVDVDHVAIGPAGILAVQTRWTNRADPRGKPAVRARIAAQQLQRALARREIEVEVVPAVLTFGPGLTEEPGGVKVVDAVAVLNGYQSEAWLEQLSTRSLLDDGVVAVVREAVAALREDAVPAAAASASTARPLALVH